MNEIANKLFEEHGIKTDIEVDHPIIKNIKNATIEWSKISEKQVALVKKLARNPATTEHFEPVQPGQRIQVTGTILHACAKETEYGVSGKMLIRTDYGAKLWGTWASSISTQAIEREIEEPFYTTLRGYAATFTANVVASDKDKTFGFFNRPTKVKLGNKTSGN